MMWEETPPQTGTSLPFIWPPPEHLQTPPPFQEPVLPSPPPESLLAREIKLDALRCEEPSKHQGVQVYDSLNRPSRADYPDARGATRDEDMPRWYVPSGPEDDTVVFESRFESGNLRSAERIDESEYNLHLAFDINTDRHTQWFYFRMSNLRKGRAYKLNMQNLMKTEAVYNLGMQPIAYSQARAQQEGVGWYRAGSDACYFKNQLTRAGAKPFWTLTFVVKTDFDQDTLYLAHCFPYRYTDLQRYLRELESSPLGVSSAIRRRTLCETLAGNVCDLLTITSPGGCHAEKKGIVISARVHPGETNASWMMKGVLDYLASDCHCAVALRDKYVFKIVPILNPDGVIVGNYRCSLAGGDLNRQYEEPKRELFPEVMNLKQMISNFSISKEVLMFVDLHGHSKKSNIFMYGVENPTDEALYMRERVIPTLLHDASPLFNMGDCTFDIGKGKEGCGRVVVRRQLGIVNAYTMEASFMGADQGEYQGVHFHQGHYEAMGHSLCEVLLDLVDTDQSKVEGIVQKLKDRFPIDQSRVVSRDGYGNRGDDSSSTTSSDGSDSPGHRRQRHHLVPRPPTSTSTSKPSSPSARPGSRPSSSAGRWRKISQHIKGTVVDSASPGGGKNEEGKKQTPRSARSETTINSRGSGLSSPATQKPPSPSNTTLVHTRPSTPRSGLKASAAGNTAVKTASAKSGGGKTSASQASSAATSQTSGGSKQKEKYKGKGKGPSLSRSVTAGARPVGPLQKEKEKEKEKEKVPGLTRSVTAGARAASPQLKGKGKAAPEAESASASSPRAGATGLARAGSSKLAVGGRKSGVLGQSGGGTTGKASKGAAVPPLALARADTSAANGKKTPKKAAKPKGAPPVGPPAPAQRPKSSPASRSFSSPRRTAAAAAAADAPRRVPSAPSKTGVTRADSSRGTKAKNGGGGGGGREQEEGGHATAAAQVQDEESGCRKIDWPGLGVRGLLVKPA